MNGQKMLRLFQALERSPEDTYKTAIKVAIKTPELYRRVSEVEEEQDGERGIFGEWEHLR